MSDAEQPRTGSVSKLATERAMRRIMGDHRVDPVKWRAYQERVSRRQRAFWGGIHTAGTFYETAARVVGSSVTVQGPTFLSGGLVYLASVEEQAKLDGRPMRTITPTAARRGIAGALLTGPNAPETVRNATAAFSREVKDEDLARLANSDLGDVVRIAREQEPTSRASISNSPFAGEYEAAIVKAAGLAMEGIGASVLDFVSVEQGFCEAEAERVWKDVADPAVIFCQLMGAATTKAMVRP